MDSLGTVITFYSYKGGSGRTMALANVAFLLACQGKSVCAIDWDIEAPGLHRYFHPFLADPELAVTEGLIDFLSDAAALALTPVSDEEGTTGSEDGEPEVDVLDYLVAVDWPFPSGGSLDVLFAGRQGPDYARRATSFEWETFYTRLGGGKTVHAARERLRAEYEYVLIDSRTGVSDTSGICTVQMPDRLVACYTLNRQSIEGVCSVMGSVTKQRADNPIEILPLELRVEANEKLKCDAARRAARPRFERYVGPSSREYWRQMEVAYWPFYAFEESLAVFGDDETRSSLSLLDAMERVTAMVSRLPTVTSPVIEEEERKRVMKLYALGELAWPDAEAEPGPRPLAVTGSANDELWAEVDARFVAWVTAEPGVGDLLPSHVLRQVDEAGPLPPSLRQNREFMGFLAKSRDANLVLRRRTVGIALGFAVIALTVVGYLLVPNVAWLAVPSSFAGLAYSVSRISLRR